MKGLYQKLKTKARGCRDRDIRIKLELILLAIKLGNITEACARRGFSRRFYYRWFGRLKKSGWELGELSEKSRKPHYSPRRSDPKLEKAVHWYSNRNYGSPMIQALLRREGIKLAKSTICHILNKRRRPDKKRKPRLNPHKKRYELVIPGLRLQMDVKYVPELVEGIRLYNYVAVDECSRWRYAKAYPALNEQMTYDFLKHLKANVPFPIHCIQTDNGPEFTFRLLPTATPESIANHLMEVWCRENSVVHRCIKPGAKELNGKVERSHRIDEQYFYWQAPTDTLEHFNRAQALWLTFYNMQRLHGGLGFITPKEKLMERFDALKKGPGPEFVQAQGYWPLDLLERLRLQFVLELPRRITHELYGQQKLVSLQSRRATTLLLRQAPLGKLKKAA